MNDLQANYNIFKLGKYWSVNFSIEWFNFVKIFLSYDSQERFIDDVVKINRQMVLFNNFLNDS